MTFKELSQLFATKGGSLSLVGGSVRDHIMKRPSKDLDYLVLGLSYEQIVETLNTIPNSKVDLVGKSFGVVKARIDGQDLDFSLPRSEVSTGTGHRDFNVNFDVSLEEDLSRRDFTINAMAMDPDGKIFDPFNGLYDIERGYIKAVGNADERFTEDPLRVVRAIQFAVRFGFEIAPSTRLAAGQADLSSISGERILEEFKKAWLVIDDTTRLSELCYQYLRRIFGPDFSPSEYRLQYLNSTERIECGFTAMFLMGGDYKLLKPSNDLADLLESARALQQHKELPHNREILEKTQTFYIHLSPHISKLTHLLSLPLNAKELAITGELIKKILENRQCFEPRMIGLVQRRLLRKIHLGQLSNEYYCLKDEVKNFNLKGVDFD